MADIISHSSIEWESPAKARYNGKLYWYMSNTNKRDLPMIEAAAANAGVSLIFSDQALDMNARPMPGYLATSMADEDYRTGDAITRLAKEVTRLTKEYRDRLIKEGKISEDTLLCDIYCGCENDPEFLNANAPKKS